MAKKREYITLVLTRLCRFPVSVRVSQHIKSGPTSETPCCFILLHKALAQVLCRLARFCITLPKRILAMSLSSIMLKSMEHLTSTRDFFPFQIKWATTCRGLCSLKNFMEVIDETQNVLILQSHSKWCMVFTETCT